jgi:hypothetical protein
MKKIRSYDYRGEITAEETENEIIAAQARSLQAK